MKQTVLIRLLCLTVLLMPTVYAQAQADQNASPRAASQDKFTISGYIKDASNGEGLIGVSVYVKETATGAVTNSYGFYAVTVPAGTYNLVITYVGYEKQNKTLTLTDQNIRLDLELKEEGRQLQEVVVSTKRDDDNVKNIEMSVNRIDVKTLQRIPALLGEVDVVRSIQLLPGVSTVGEGATGFNVRGGSIDQNLVLLDEAPVYNSSHLFGFFSVFNPDAVKDVKLVKGGIPALYGGRVSSILDVRLKEGNAKKPELNGGIGLIFSRLSYERPLFKGKGSFIVAGRRSYADILAQPFLNNDLKGAKFYFYDLTAKANYRFNDKNTVFLSGYFGRDVFGADFGFNWGNTTASARWNHVFSDKLFLNTTAYYSNYDYSLDSDLKRRPENANDYFRTDSRIVDYSIKPDFTLFLGKSTITFGGQSILHDFQPGTATAASSGDVRTFGLTSKYALENAVYIGNEQQVSPKLQLQYGLRYSLFNYVGPGDAYAFTTDVPLGTSRFPITTIQYKRGETIQTYGNWEPRFSAKYELGNNSSLKLSYNRLAQYIHLISNTTASTPLDIWTPSTNNIKPQIGDQIAGGFFKNFGRSNGSGSEFEASVEVYYKWLQNQIDYIDGANLILNKFLEGDLLSGKGRAYGAEFYIKRNRGTVNGWVSYTLARTERQVAGINGGGWFPTRFDKPHTLTTVLLVDPPQAKRWNFSATFTLASGTPATFPTNRFEFGGFTGQVISGRNNYRIPPYHRLDLAATLQGRQRPGKRKTDNWVFSVYNVYARKNPFSVFFQPDADNPRLTQAIRYSVFATAIPSVTYNFKF
ncbi:TonB-dependent receptor [Spirosoma sordidisoli]|uniref:TonB-dependent receptor n=2 Tax=Cytophagaceae TaxID=89373 RepID=A0A4Q2ULI7_9BACT|nr:TonB-dependent receptor [Spirosoma sordidisoli]